MPKIVKGGPTSILLQNIKKWKGTIWCIEIFFEKELSCEKNLSWKNQDSQSGNPWYVFEALDIGFVLDEVVWRFRYVLDIRISSWTIEQKSGLFVVKKLPTVRVGHYSSKAPTKKTSSHSFLFEPTLTPIFPTEFSFIPANQFHWWTCTKIDASFISHIMILIVTHQFLRCRVATERHYFSEKVVTLQLRLC